MTPRRDRSHEEIEFNQIHLQSHQLYPTPPRLHSFLEVAPKSLTSSNCTKLQRNNFLFDGFPSGRNSPPLNEIETVWGLPLSAMSFHSASADVDYSTIYLNKLICHLTTSVLNFSNDASHHSSSPRFTQTPRKTDILLTQYYS